MHIRDRGIRYDWLGRLCACLNTDRAGYPQKLRDWQGANGLAPTGFIDAQTRLKLIEDEAFNNDLTTRLKIRTYGVDKNLWRTTCALSTSGTEAALYDRLTDILLALHSYVPEEPFSASILAIRGVTPSGDGYHHTESARMFAQQPYGARTHFSSNKADYADSLFALMTREGKEKHVQCFMGVTSPCSIWPHGTAHLCLGQYFYKIGKHRTREPAHIETAEAMFRNRIWPENWLYERTEDSIRYAALEGTSQIEVVRSTGDSLDISPSDIARAEREIAERNPAFVDAQTIKINIHSCSQTHASSLGCQNILPEDYRDFLGTLMRIADLQTDRYGFALDIPYTLCDASELPT
ncbi:MAG: hypothetical protein IKY83_00095 [Proteobacteria bacterium]|nr:hypothetical protein [Pseudomonadota bacterium]